MDVWLGVVHWLRRSSTTATLPDRLREAWRALPGDSLGLAVMRGCGIEARRASPTPAT